VVTIGQSLFTKRRVENNVMGGNANDIAASMVMVSKNVIRYLGILWNI
jgi:hypothetical protein